MKLKTIRMFFALALTLGAAMLSVAAAEPAHDGYLVKFKGEVLLHGELASAEPIINQVYLVRDLSLIQEQVEDGGIEYIEPNVYVSLFGEVGESTDGWFYTAMRGDAALAHNLTGSGVRVGILDSGLNRTSDLDDAVIATGYNFLKNTEDTADIYGHGTIVASMIAADHDASGISGIAPGVTLVPLKCFSNANDSTIAVLSSAIRKAADSTLSGGFACNIIQMSWGIPSSDSTLQSAIQYANSCGAILVASAGNAGGSTKYYPASYPGVISVAGVDPDLKKAAYSQSNDSVTLTAPGTSVYPGAYLRVSKTSGTSFSAPCVAAAAALLLEKDRALTSTQVQEVLSSHAMDLGPMGYDPDFGFGFVRIDWLLDPASAVTRLHWQASANHWQGAYRFGDTLHLSGGLDAAVPTKIIAAAFTKNGKLLRSKTESFTAGAMTYDLALGSTESVGFVRLFILKNNFAPYVPKTEWIIQK